MDANTLVFNSKSWWKPEWDLVRDSQVMGTFSISKPFSYAEAIATYAGKKWRLAHSLWSWTNNITAYDEAGNKIAEMGKIGSWWKSGYAIEIAGKKYTIAGNSWWMRYSITDEQNREVVALRLNWWGKAMVEMPNLNPDSTAMLLVFICFYQAKLVEMQSAAAAGAAVIVSAS